MKKLIKSPLANLLDEITPLEQAKTNSKMILASRIADAMQIKNWKNKDLLNAVGKESPSLVTKWLSGTHNFTVDTLVELEKALNISLLNLEEDVKKEVIVSYHVVVKSKGQLPSSFSNFNNYLSINEKDSEHFLNALPATFYTAKIPQS